MNLFFSTTLTLLTILFLAFPFLRRKQTPVALGEQSSVPVNQKDLILGTLGEIEFDYHMNKLSKEDYQALKNNYAQIAVEVLESEESRVDLQKLEAEIEQELRAMTESEQTTPASSCSRCGTPLLKADQEFCHECGERQN